MLPRLKETFISQAVKPASQERDTSKDSGLMVILENMKIIVDNCPAKDFKEGPFSPVCPTVDITFANPALP